MNITSVLSDGSTSNPIYENRMNTYNGRKDDGISFDIFSLPMEKIAQITKGFLNTFFSCQNVSHLNQMKGIMR